MLIRFVVSNFLSFKEGTEFNMLTGNFKIHEDHVYKSQGLEILKSAAVYGANGAGKSNLIKAINFLKKVIVRGVIDEAPTKHKTASECLSKPTTFAIEFMTASGIYYYSLAMDGSKIESEELIKSSLKDEKVIFERTVSKDGKQKLTLLDRYMETDEDRLRKRLLEEEFLVVNRPFLAVAANLKENKFREITEVFDWIREKLVIIFPHSRPSYVLANFIFLKEFHQFSDQLLCGFDTGIKKIEIETLSFEKYFGKDDVKQATAVADQLNTMTSDKSILRPFVEIKPDAIAMKINGKMVIKKLFMIHSGEHGQDVNFDLSEESDGTQKLFYFIPAFYLLLFQNAVVLFDEIDQSIHAYLLKSLLSKVMNEKQMSGQIIFTTHESNLLDLNIFRQDEIWFASKTSQGETKLYSLSEYKPRYDLDIRKGYLNGRFGALPNTKHLENFNWTKNEEAKQGV